MHTLTYHAVLLYAGILTVGAIEACGFDPCFEKACKVDLTARCVSDSDCKPTFISKTQRILDECVGKQKSEMIKPQLINRLTQNKFVETLLVIGVLDYPAMVPKCLYEKLFSFMFFLNVLMFPFLTLKRTQMTTIQATKKAMRRRSTKPTPTRMTRILKTFRIIMTMMKMTIMIMMTMTMKSILIGIRNVRHTGKVKMTMMTTTMQKRPVMITTMKQMTTAIQVIPERRISHQWST